MKKLYLHNLGCAKNQIDGEVFAGWVSEENVRLTDVPEEADVIVINTCAFIQEAKEEAIEAVLEAARLKKEASCSRLFVAGCFPERYRNRLKAELPEVDGFFGVHEWDALLKSLTGREIGFNENPFLRRELSTPGHYAYIRIADGCDRGCAYCVIPKLRGSYRSRPPEAIIEEAENLARRGVKELLPVAQELNSYGHDIGIGKKNRPLISLLGKLCRIDGIDWIRPLYLHPPAVDETLLEFWASREKLCRYLDLPIEHASDRMLKAMGRSGNQEQLRRMIEKTRAMMPDVVLRTSIIVGFPGETEPDFEALLEFVREVRFERLGSFQFSAEEGTAAASLPDQVPEQVKAERQERLMTLQSKISFEHGLNRVGYAEEIVVDRYEEDSGLSVAHSRRELPDLDGEMLITGRYPSGTRLTVRNDSATEYDLFATPLNEKTADDVKGRLSAGEHP